MAGPLYDPAGMATGPAVSGPVTSRHLIGTPRVSDPRFAADVGRMRRVGYSDAQIEKALQKLPEPDGGSMPSPLQSSPVQQTPIDPTEMATGPAVSGSPLPATAAPAAAPASSGLPSLDLNFNALQDAGYPYQVAGPNPVQGMPPAGAPPFNPPSNFAAEPPAPMGWGDPVTASLYSGAVDGAPPMPMPRPDVTPEMLAAFGGGAPAAPGAGPAPMAAPPVPGANPFQGQPPQTMGPPTRAAVGPRAGGQPNGSQTAATPAEGEEFDYGGMGENLLRFGLATMAAGAQPGATVAGAVGQGGLSTLSQTAERRRYEKVEARAARAEARAERAESRADETLDLRKTSQEETKAYRDRQLDIQERRLLKTGGEDPARVKEARWLVENDIYSDLATAYDATRTRAETDPATVRANALKWATSQKNSRDSQKYTTPEEIDGAMRAYVLFTEGKPKDAVDALKKIDPDARKAADEPGYLGRLWGSITDGGGAPTEASSVRRLNPGEFVQNADGSKSTERSITVTDPRLNDGKPTNIPSIWNVGGEIVELPFTQEGQRQAIEYALQSGDQWQGYGSIKEAERAAQQRSNAGGRFSDADKKGGTRESPAKITSDDEYNALPPKAFFTGPDGILRQKP